MVIKKDVLRISQKIGKLIVEKITRKLFFIKKNVPLGTTVTIVKRIVALTVEFLGCVTEKLEVACMHFKMDGKEANVSGVGLFELLY